MHGQVGAFWEVLSEQSVGVLIGTALPRALWITEVDINIGRQCEALVVGKFFAAIPYLGLLLVCKINPTSSVAHNNTPSLYQRL